MLDETELRRRYARPEHAIGGDVAVFDRETAKRPLQRIKWQPEIKQRAKDHVARRAGKAIQIQHARNQQPKPTSDLRPPKIMTASSSPPSGCRSASRRGSGDRER